MLFRSRAFRRRPGGNLKEITGDTRVQVHPASGKIINLLRGAQRREQCAEASPDAEADASRVSGADRSACTEEATEECDGRAHAQKCLAIEGKHREDQDGVGMKMESLDPIVIQDDGEEGGERGNQTREDGVEEEGVAR